MAQARRVGPLLTSLPKSPTGIPGMDEITGGGLPKGRPTLVAGGAGCGKTLFAMEFLVNGAVQYDEPGVFVAFEENADVERFTEVFRPDQTTRESEWATKTFARMDDATYQRIANLLESSD